MSKREPEAACISDAATPQTSNAISLSHNAMKRNNTAEQDEEYKNLSTATELVLSTIQKSKSLSSMHGELYSTYLAISIILHQFKKQNKFIVATEVSAAGKFDDILYHNESPQGKSTLFIQAKHRKNTGSCITIENLCVAKGDFSIPMYFSSFLDIDQNLTGGEPETRKTRYAICTNAKLHQNANSYFTEIDLQEDDSLQFCKVIGAKCYRLSSDISGLIDKLKDSCKGKLTTDSAFYEQTDLFFGKFLLICNSVNKNELREQARNLLPRWCDEVQRERVVDKLADLLNNLIDSNPRYYMDLERMQKCILETELNQNISDLKRSSREYREFVHEKHSHIEVNPERLKDSKLCKFLENKPNCGIYEFTSTLDLTVSSRILIQALSLLQYETLFVDSTRYATHQHMLDILDNLLLYLRDVNHHPTIEVITILGKQGHESVVEIEKLSEKYFKKIVVIEKMAVSPQNNETFDEIQVKDLSDKALKQLYTQNERMMFGTKARLSSIVEETDKLSLLLDVLELCDQPRKTVDRNLNEQNYEKIIHWYVQRHYEQYKQMLNLTNDGNRLFISNLEIDDILAKNDKECDPPVLQDGNGGKVCIFLNDAGLGKTTYFTWLAWRLSTSDRSLHVIKFNAVEYSTDFDQLEGSNLQNYDDIEIVRILYRYIHFTLSVPNTNKRWVEKPNEGSRKADRCAKLLTLGSDGRKIVLEKTNSLSTEELIELRLFKEKFNDRQLVLILDGFDEIAPHYKDVVLKCFARFARLDGVRSLYLSSRPYGFEEELKKTFDQCRMYRLAPFSKRDIILSFNKFLLINIDGYKHYEPEHRNDVLEKLYAVIKHILNNIFTVPLLLYMVKIILLPEIKKRVNIHYHSISDQMLDATQIDILHLIEMFIDRKIKILNTDKTGTTDSAGATPTAKKIEALLKKEVKEQHMLLAMCVLFDKNDREKLLSKKEQKRADEIMKEVNQGDEKTGIVLGVQNGVPHFLHRTFAEYFSACWLVENWERFKSERIFHSQTIWSHSMEKTREFFNRLILRESEGCDLHLALVNNSNIYRYSSIEKIVRNNPSAVTVKDKVGRLPLHMVEYNRTTYSILEMTPPELKNEKDNLYGWNVLDYAFVFQDRYFIEMLFKRGAQPNMDNLYQKVCFNNVDELLRQGIMYGNIFDQRLRRADLAEELSERVAKYLIEEKQIDIYAPLIRYNFERRNKSVLQYVAVNDNVYLFRQLITKSDPQALDREDRVNPLFKISLEERAYGITNFLIERHPSLVSMINDNAYSIQCANSAIVKNQIESFKTIFRQFCIEQNIECVEEDNIIDELAHQEESETYEIGIPVEKYCCYKSSEKAPDHRMKGLLFVAIHFGNTQTVSYILQKTNMVITVELIGTIMKQLRRLYSENENHEKCMPTFKYLFSKTPDLYAVDKKGLNLFLMIMKYGCVYMLPSLIAVGFDPKMISMTNYWDVFEELSSRYQYCLANKLVYLQQRSIVDCFDTISPFFKSIFDIAITKKHYIVAQALVEYKFNNLSNSEKENTVLDLLYKLLIEYGEARNFKFVKSCLEESSTSGAMENEMWHSVYCSIFQQSADKLHLVERIIDRRIEIFNKDNTGSTNSASTTAAAKKKELMEQYMLLAICAMYNKKDKEKLLSQEEQKRADEIIKKVNQGDEKTGIVLGVQNEVPQFLHRTFAVYFSARWLVENRERFKSERIFHSRTIWSRSMEKTREIFNQLILRESEDCDFHLALVYSSTTCGKYCIDEGIEDNISNNPSVVTVKDEAGRLPFHLVEYTNESSMTLILDMMPPELMNEKDSLHGWNALDYAFVLDNYNKLENLIEMLFKRGVIPNVDNLCQQVCSNDVDVLLEQGKNYENLFYKLLKRTDLADELSERVAKYLIEQIQIDIYAPLAELNSLSVLEEAATKDYFHLFRQLITQSDPQALDREDRLNPLFKISLEERAYRIASFLIERHSYLVFKINNIQDLFGCVKGAIEHNQMESFKAIFGQFCIKQNIECDEEDNIIDELVNQDETETFEIEIPFENDCCDELSEDEDSNMEGLLSVAIHYGNTRKVSYILQKTKMVVTVELIGTIMKQLRRLYSENENHEKCMPAFKYLFSKTPDLYAVDRNGLNLFLMIMKYGCVYMLPSLIAVGFDKEKMSMINHWGVFQKILNECDSANKLVYLQQRSIVDCFKIGPKGMSILGIAISEWRFTEAQALVEDKFHSLSSSGKKRALLDVLNQLSLNIERQAINKFVSTLRLISSHSGKKENKIPHSVYNSVYVEFHDEM